MKTKTRFARVRGRSVALAALTLATTAFAADSSIAPAASPAPGASAASGKTFIDYFLPIPAHGPLSKDAWGAPNVLPRDPQNGLEDPTIKQWCYWDGQIIKGPDGKYHMFASRWDQAKGHNGWFGSVAVHAVSDSMVGPYVDKGLCWPDDQGGKGHNVTALVLPDGRYAVVVSETRPGDVFVSKSLDGPWEHLGAIQVDAEKWRASNYSIMVRPDGDFEIVPRSGQILLSKTGILGPYKIQGPSVYPSVAGLPLRNLEDPVVWFSGGLYHIVVNGWSDRKAYHITSPNGITNWTFRGLAYDPTRDFVRYTDGTVNHWEKLERPGVLLENGHVVAVTLAVLDVPKNEEKGDDNHGSKVIVIPFDGAALDRDLAADAGK
ncbi:MAG TPA: glycoside hydrolase family protein [Opitutaceae bacterium]|nr:glycoside hydrolase family protein [Opitutaceae bacterium]